VSTPTTEQPIRENLLAFLARRTNRPLTSDTDLFAAGLVSSMFALELVVHVESEFGVTVEGPDLRLDNFRTVDAMTELVLRLRGDSP
jgi:methoxymalonate biosynthesis acyl carrier protein